MKKLFNFLWGSIEVINSADGPSQMAIYDTIGKDDFSGGGITGSDFSQALNSANNAQDLHIHVNSKGGDVHHGMSMRNALKAWKQKTGRKVTTIIDGIAASTASWAFPTASDEVKAYKGSQVFVHEAMALAAGSAENFRDTADILDKTSMQIADMYAEKSGKPASMWRNKMKSGSLMTGDEAKGEGLVDFIIDGNATNFGPWVETVKQQLVIQNQVLNYNENHDEKGQFATGGGSGSGHEKMEHTTIHEKVNSEGKTIGHFVKDKGDGKTFKKLADAKEYARSIAESHTQVDSDGNEVSIYRNLNYNENHDEKGQFAEGETASSARADADTRAAEDASHNADEHDSANLHQVAAKLNREAAQSHKEASRIYPKGSSFKARHERMATEHRQAASWHATFSKNQIISSAPTQGAENDKQNEIQIMNKTQMLALLNKWGVDVPKDATDEKLIELVNAGPKAAPAAPVVPPVAAPTNIVPMLSAADQQILNDLKLQLSNSRRKEIQAAIEKGASLGLIPANEIENWVNDAVAVHDNPTTGNSVINRMNKLTPVIPGMAPVPMENHKLDVVNADIKDISKGFQLHNESTKAFQRGLIDGEQAMKTIRNDAVAKANFFKKFKNRFLEVMNTNTIDAGLQRQVILQDVVIRDFARRVISLSMFSTVFRDVPLQGLDSVEVPYFDLDTSASTKFVSGTGYTTVGNTSSDKREIKIGETATNTAGTTGGARLYQALAFSSQEIARQPYLKVAELAGLKAEKLAFDIWQDILSVITVANFGAAAITKAAAQFDSDQIALLKLACKKWPEGGRGLVLDSAYDANLLQDPSFKFALNAASDLAIKEGRLFPRVMGFDYTENPNIPANAINLVGFAVWKYAILVAFAPVPPVEEVRRAGTVWELITDPATGISLEYRQFGTNVTDVATNVIESSYGYAAGLKTALKMIVSA